MSEPPQPSQLAALIPEIAYDMTGRIPVGAAFLVAIAADRGAFATQGIMGPEVWHTLSAGAVAGIALLLLAGGFIVGLPFSVWGYLPELLYRGRAWRNVPIDELRASRDYIQTIHRNVALPKDDEQWQWQDYTTMYSLSHDLVKSDGPDTAALVQKLSGERIFFQTSMVAVIAWAAHHWWWCARPFSCRLLFALVALEGCLFWGASMRYERLVRRQLSLLLVRKARTAS